MSAEKEMIVDFNYLSTFIFASIATSLHFVPSIHLIWGFFFRLFIASFAERVLGISEPIGPIPKNKSISFENEKPNSPKWNQEKRCINKFQWFSCLHASLSLCVALVAASSRHERSSTSRNTCKHARIRMHRHYLSAERPSLRHFSASLSRGQCLRFSISNEF